MKPYAHNPFWPGRSGRGSWLGMLACCLIGGLCCCLCWAQPLVAHIDLANRQGQVLTDYFEAVEDVHGQWMLSDLRTPALARRFQPASSLRNGLNFGYTRSAWWLRIRLRNDSAQTLQRVLEVGEATLGSVQFYQALPDDSFSVSDTGNLRPFSSRVYPNRQFVFPISVPPRSEQVHYLRIQSRHAMLVTTQLWQPEAFHHTERIEYSIQAGYLGMVFAMILFNLLLFFALRESIYLHYLIFTTSFTMYIFVRNGMASEFLPPALAQWVNPAYSPLVSFAMVALLQFMRTMLASAQFFPRLDRLCLGMILIEAGVGISYFFVFDLAVQINTYIHLIAILLIFAVSMICSYYRARSAQFFLAAFSALLFGGMLSSLRVLGWLPSNDFTTHVLQFGSVLEMLLLAFALADRLNLIFKEKEDAQSEALYAQQNLLDNLRTSEALLEQRVAERSQALVVSNQSLALANEELNNARINSENLRQAAEQARQHTDHLSIELQRTQEQLIQAEKMAALGQLIFRVAQEIDTPIRTIKQEGKALSDTLSQALQRLPALMLTLTPEQQQQLLISVQQGEKTIPPMLVTHADLILPMLAHARTITVSTKRINGAAERVSLIIKSLKHFAYFNKNQEQIDFQAELEHLLAQPEAGKPAPFT